MKTKNYRILLARHGEDLDNAREILNGTRNMPLTEKGIAQAHELVDTIINQQITISYVFTSPKRRALKTALIAACRLKTSLSILESMIERNHGILEGRPYSDIPLLAREYTHKDGFTYVVDVEGGETYPALCARASRVLADIHTKAQELNITGNILVVAHGALNKALLISHKGLPWTETFNLPYFTNCEFRVLD